jgi:hypothetical protein
LEKVMLLGGLGNSNQVISNPGFSNHIKYLRISALDPFSGAKCQFAKRLPFGAITDQKSYYWWCTEPPMFILFTGAALYALSSVLLICNKFWD